VRLFGPFTVLKGGRELPPLRTRKGQSLLALLVLRGGRGIERTWLAGTLWPDSAEAQARYNLRRSLSDLRQALGSEADRIHSGGQPQTLAFDLQDAVVDVVVFDEAIERGDVPSLQAAAALHHGPLLEGCLELWVLPERQARERSLANALELLARDAVAKGDASAAERYLRRAIRLDPFRETAQRALMQTLADAGSPSAALQCFRDLRLLLAHELRAEPAPETTALYRQIRADARRLLQHPPSSLVLPRAAAPRHIPHPRTTFLGRAREVEEHPVGPRGLVDP
jgi:DNA-binding SARP family transcriptional activator